MYLAQCSIVYSETAAAKLGVSGISELIRTDAFEHELLTTLLAEGVQAGVVTSFGIGKLEGTGEGIGGRDAGTLIKLITQHLEAAR